MKEEIEQAMNISNQENEMFKKIFHELFDGFFDEVDKNAKSDSN